MCKVSGAPKQINAPVALIMGETDVSVPLGEKSTFLLLTFVHFGNTNSGQQLRAISITRLSCRLHNMLADIMANINCWQLKANYYREKRNKK